MLQKISFLVLALLLSTSPGAYAANQCFPSYICVNGYLHKPNGQKEHVGSSECERARMADGFACVNGYLYLPNSNKEHVGSSECDRAKMGGGYACVNGYLYKPDGSKEHVGSSECDRIRLPR